MSVGHIFKGKNMNYLQRTEEVANSIRKVAANHTDMQLVMFIRALKIIAEGMLDLNEMELTPEVREKIEEMERELNEDREFLKTI